MSGVEDRDLGFEAALEQLRLLNGATVLVGIQGEQAAASGTGPGLVPDEGNMAYIASIHEFGAEWTVTAKQAYYMAAHLMDIDPEADKARFWGTVRALTGKTMKIPERSFMRAGIDNNAAAIEEAMRRVVSAVSTGDMSAFRALGQFGLLIEQFIKRQLAAVQPGLAPLTIANRTQHGNGAGGDRPLQDTGRMKNSIRAVVTEGGASG